MNILDMIEGKIVSSCYIWFCKYPKCKYENWRLGAIKDHIKLNHMPDRKCKVCNKTLDEINTWHAQQFGQINKYEKINLDGLCNACQNHKDYKEFKNRKYIQLSLF